MSEEQTEIISGDAVTARVSVALAEFTKDRGAVLDQLSRVEVVDQDSYSRATSLMNLITKISNAIEKERKSLTGPLTAASKQIKGSFDAYREPLEVGKKEINAKLLKWHSEERKRREKEAAEERRKAEEAALEAAEKVKDPDVADVILDSVAEVRQDKIDGSAEIGSSHLATRWVGKVHDEKAILQAIINDELPLATISFSPAELNRFARKTEKEGVVHGVKIIKEESIRGRS